MEKMVYISMFKFKNNFRFIFKFVIKSHWNRSFIRVVINVTQHYSLPGPALQLLPVNPESHLEDALLTAYLAVEELPCLHVRYTGYYPEKLPTDGIQPPLVELPRLQTGTGFLLNDFYTLYPAQDVETVFSSTIIQWNLNK